MQNAVWLCSWCPWVTSSSHYWAQSVPSSENCQLLDQPSSLAKPQARARARTWACHLPFSRLQQSPAKKQWEIKVMAKGQVKGYSTWSTYDSLQKGESHHKTIISFTQQLQMSELSGFYFSPLNVTASGVRIDEYSLIPTVPDNPSETQTSPLQ